MALHARSASEPSTTGRIEPVRTGRVLKSKAYLVDSLARKNQIKIEDAAKEQVSLMMGSQDLDLTTRFVPPPLVEVKDKPKTVYFYGGAQPRIAVTYTRKVYRTFGKK
jgi:hypothetical protein